MEKKRERVNEGAFSGGKREVELSFGSGHAALRVEGQTS